MKEQTRHRAAFNVYWSLGPARSIEALHGELQRNARKYGFARPPHLRTVFAWSSRFDWQGRLAALEAAAREVDREAHIGAIREMNDRQAREGLALQQKALHRLNALEPEELTPVALIRALLAGAKLERLARGETTERTEVEGALSHGIDLSGFSDEELRRLARLAARHADGAGEPESR